MSARALAPKTFHIGKMIWTNPGIRTAATHHLHERAIYDSLFPFHKMMQREKTL